MKCEHCGYHELVYVKENFPYNIPHLMCDECYSTYTMCDEYKDEIKESIINFLLRHKETNVKVDMYYEYFDKSFIDELINVMVKNEIIEKNNNEIRLKDNW